MLKIKIKDKECWNQKTERFVIVEAPTIVLEHSLVSLSKWEAKYKRPFLRENPKKTNQETLDYIRFMTITQNVSDDVYNLLSNDELKQINSYIEDSMTATYFSENSPKKGGKSRKKGPEITSELIYYWMIQYNIPFSCEKWHLNRLLTLIRICANEEEAKAGKGKMSKKDILLQNRALNAARRKKLNTKG